MKNETVFYERKFLNKKGYHSNAFIFAEILKNTASEKKKKNVWRDTQLKISDCDRIVNLSMDISNLKLAANSIHKLDVLIDTLQQFKRAFQRETNLMRKGK